MPGTSHCGSRTCRPTRIPASTGWLPAYRTVRPSNSKPSTGEPSGASALDTSIPTLLAQRACFARLAGQQVEDVALGDHAEGRDLAGVPNRRSVHGQSRHRKIEQRLEVLRSRHDVTVPAVEVEQEDVVPERVERGGDLTGARLRDDPSVEIDEARRTRDRGARLAATAP